MNRNCQFATVALMGIAGLLFATSGATADPHDGSIRQLLAVGSDAAGVETARKAVDDLVTVGPKALIAILDAIPEGDVVKANWLRAAVERIVTNAIREKRALPIDELLRLVQDAKRPGRARRLALEALEKAQPGTTAKLTEGWLADPEFGADAVADRMEKAAALETNDQEAAIKLYRQAFDNVTDFTQCLAVAQRLKALNITVDPLTRLGVVREWLVIGPFDDPDEKGFAKVFPPETKIDRAGSYEGKGGMIAWKRHVSEAPDGRVDLLKAIGPSEGAVGYGVAVIRVAKDKEVEVRCGGDDNIAVWVNGVKAIDHGAYRSHLRVDWHRAKVRLKAGENVILVKVCQCPAPKEKAPGPPNKWEFLLRLVDNEGRGLSLPADPTSNKK